MDIELITIKLDLEHQIIAMVLNLREALNLL